MNLRVVGLLALLPWALFGAAHSGIVRSAGHPIPGATITALHSGTVVTTTTDESGRYTFPDLAPGTWIVEIQMFGFTTTRADVVIATEPSSKEWSLDLQPRFAQRGPAGPGGIRNGRPGGFQSVDLAQRANMAELQTLVNATPEAPAAQADTGDAFVVAGSVSRGLQDATQDEVFARARMEQMAGGPNQPGAPDFNQGGAAPAAPGGGGFGGRGGGPGGFGGRPGGGGFGGPGRGGFGGRGGPGGRDGQMRDRMARNGTFGNRVNRNRNAIRGMAFLSGRNSALDAKPFSITGQNVDKADYSQVRFGASIGGALKIPKIINSDKTFFFLNYNGSRASNPSDFWATVPTALERGGDFSQTTAIIYNPKSGQPFENNRIPSGLIDPAAQKLLQFFPLPNQPGNIQNYRFVTSVPNNTDNLGIRVNQTLTKKDRLDFGYNVQRRDGLAVQLFGFEDTQDGTGWNSNIGWSHTFAPRFINNLRWAFSRNRNEVLPFFAFSDNIAATLGIQGTSTDPINFGPPNLGFTNFGGLTDASPVLQRNQTSSLTDGMTIVRGAHTVTFGGEFRKVQINTKTDQNARGTYSFSGLTTSGFDASGQPIANTGFDLADFLLSSPQSASIRYGSTSNYFRGSVYSGYLQDDWKALSNLTINTGLRYEYFTPLREKYDRLANLDVAPGFTGVAVVTPGTTGPYSGEFPLGLINPDKNNFSPRIGIAWRPFPKKQFLIRSGYGIYYNGSIYNQFPSRLASQPPFANTLSVTNSIANPLTIENGFTAVAAQDIKNTYAIARDYRVGYAQTWNFLIQTNLPKALVLEVGYLGTKGTRLDIERSPNRAAPGSPLTAEERRQIGNAVGFTYESSDGNSIYHGGHVRLTRRFRRGLSANLTYTLAKSIDNSSTFGGAGNTVAQNDKDLHAERGLSSFDQRHVFSAGYMITSPFGQQGLLHSESTLVNRLLQDWTISGSVNAASGHPFTARVLGNLTNTGGTGAVGSGRADATGIPEASGSGYFNVLAFTVPTGGGFGDAGRNTIIGPGTFSMNLGISRSFRLGDDRRRLEFRVDSTNFTNHVNITGIGTVVNAVDYGLATAAGGMRSITTSLRLRF
jgi:hypothetical protein